MTRVKRRAAAAARLSDKEQRGLKELIWFFKELAGRLRGNEPIEEDDLRAAAVCVDLLSLLLRAQFSAARRGRRLSAEDAARRNQLLEQIASGAPRKAALAAFSNDPADWARLDRFIRRALRTK